MDCAEFITTSNGSLTSEPKLASIQPMTSKFYRRKIFDPGDSTYLRRRVSLNGTFYPRPTYLANFLLIRLVSFLDPSALAPELISNTGEENLKIHVPVQFVLKSPRLTPFLERPGAVIRDTTFITYLKRTGGVQYNTNQAGSKSQSVAVTYPNRRRVALFFLEYDFSFQNIWLRCLLCVELPHIWEYQC